MWLHCVLIVIVVSDVKVMSSTVAVIFAVTWHYNYNIRTEPNIFRTESEFFFEKPLQKPNRHKTDYFAHPTVQWLSSLVVWLIDVWRHVSRGLAGFLELSQADQITLVQQGSFEVIFARYTSLFTEQGMFVPDMTARIPRSTATWPSRDLWPFARLLGRSKTAKMFTSASADVVRSDRRITALKLDWCYDCAYHAVGRAD